MKLIENEYVRARVYKADARLHTEWLRNVNPEEYKEGVNLFVKLILEEQIERWVLDSSRIHGIKLSDQQWILHHVLPALQKSKLRKIARVGSGDIFHYMSFEELVEKASQKFNLQIEVAQFTSPAMAEGWISMDE